MELKVKYLADIEPIAAINVGDWIDLRVAEDVDMTAGEYKLIHLGVAIKLPEGYEALVVPRSSTFSKFGILQANSFGVIDESYCGDGDEWKFPALAMHPTHIDKGTRICQFRIIKHQPEFEIVTVDTLGGTDRGGFGSTGTK